MATAATSSPPQSEGAELGSVWMDVGSSTLVELGTAWELLEVNTFK